MARIQIRPLISYNRDLVIATGALNFNNLSLRTARESTNYSHPILSTTFTKPPLAAVHRETTYSAQSSNLEQQHTMVHVGFGTPMNLASSATGGALMGLSAAAFIVLTGRITSLTGTFSLLASREGWRSYAAAYTAGFVATAAAIGLFMPGLASVSSGSGPAWRYILSGLLVGAGTCIAGGITDHGICGLAMLSRRSAAATATFAAAAAATAAALSHNHMLPTTGLGGVDTSTAQYALIAAAALGLASLYSASSAASGTLSSFLATVFCGGSFAAGLTIAGVTNSDKLLSFFTLDDSRWNSALGVCTAAAVLVAAAGFKYARENGKPLLGGAAMGLPISDVIDNELLFGSALFGAGVGITGLTPGTTTGSAVAVELTCAAVLLSYSHADPAT